MYTFLFNGDEYVYDNDKIAVYKRKDKDVLNLCSDGISKKKKYFANVNFILNNSCNMACSYCYANKGTYNQSKSILDFEKAKEVIDTLESLRRENKEKGFNVTFFGGEPLLEFALIKKIVKYTYTVVEDNANVSWFIVTNGTLLNDEIVSFFQKYNFGVTVSIDGLKDAHDRNRVFYNGAGSYDLIVSNMKKYSQCIEFVARLTVNNENYDVLEAVKEIRKYNVKRFVFGVDTNMSMERFNVFLKNLEKLFEYYFNCIKNKDYIIIDNIHRFIMHLVFRRKCYSHCSAGVSFFSISSDEKVYLCHRFVGKKDGYITQLGKEFYEDIIKASKENYSIVQKGVEKRVEECADCDFSNLCGGMCYYEAYMTNGEKNSKVELMCRQKKILIKETIKLLLALSVQERREYLLFIKDYGIDRKKI